MKKVTVYCVFLYFAGVQLAGGQSIVNTRHNLSASGPGSIRALSEEEICIFCHTPHNSLPESPLWNREDPGVIYDLYNSSSVESAPGQPDGASLLCLSCHDGTIALGNVLNRTTTINFTGGVTHLPPGESNLSTDLSDDHPVSIIYSSGLATTDGQLYDPSLVTYPVSLSEGKVQCTSCHDPHKDLYSKFLVMSPQFSELCIQCHNRDYWSSSIHRSSTAAWNGTGTDPWPHTSFNTVAENACESCHRPHSAGGEPRLMNYLAEESNCLSCHNGNVAGTSIENELSKPYTHNPYGYTLVHDPEEDPLVLTMHAECQDCHNSHAVNETQASAPHVSGSLAGTIGITLAGTPVEPSLYQYEICFRCHGDSPGKPAGHTTRAIEQTNTRLEFNPGNPSHHPVAATGQNADVPSLIVPDHSESSMIYCTDCHAGDGPSGSNGPHGSNWQSLLKYRYETADLTVESPENYALCYSCHGRTSILNDESFSYHYLHIVDELTPCNACHDPHGISYTQGNSTNNSHLINFDMNIVMSSGAGVARFVDTGYEDGYCQLRCHGQGHGIGMSY
jgi:predicted CXXCH cytochrome family protein